MELKSNTPEYVILKDQIDKIVELMMTDPTPGVVKYGREVKILKPDCRRIHYEKANLFRFFLQTDKCDTLHYFTLIIKEYPELVSFYLRNAEMTYNKCVVIDDDGDLQQAYLKLKLKYT